MDLIQKAKNLGCTIKNDEYYLWEIQKWLRDKHLIFLESKQTTHGDTGWTIVGSSAEILKEEVIWPYYDGYPVEGHMFEESGYENTIQEALKLIKT